MPAFSFVRLVRLVSFLLGAVAALAQPVPPPGGNVVSPEIAADHHVTFRLFAPGAHEVSVLGQWDNVPHALAKDALGIWTVTLGPIAPDYWIYNFIVDGAHIADPVNPQIKLRMRTSASLLDLPANPPALWDIRGDIPHGAVEMVWHNSKVTGDTRSFYVYTPPGYDPTDSKRYPVLYLIHGSNGLAGDWTSVGRANFMADNLLAAGRMVPMIIVMPAGHAVPYNSRTGPENGPTFERYLVEEVIPAVDKKYRVLTDRDHRAVMGLSMGGGHAWRAGFGHPDLFAWIGSFSAGGLADFENRYSGLLADAPATNARFRMLWVGCGKQDPAFAGSEKLDAMLTQAKVRHTFFAIDGVHNFVFWRRCFEETVPLLFKPGN